MRYSRVAIDETQHQRRSPLTEVLEQHKLGIGFPGNRKVPGVRDRLPARLLPNAPDSCLHRRNGTAKKLQTWWRHNCTGAPPLDPHTLLTPGNDTTQVGNTACATWWQWGSLPLLTQQYATGICPCTYGISHWSMFQSQSICWGSPAWNILQSGYHAWRCHIQRLVQCLLCGNPAKIHFTDQRSLLSKPASEGEYWSNGMR
jgi:hypothetical protein